MKVEITRMKAPWPPGAAVGDVVDVPGDVLPGCLVGKCKPADAAAKAAHVYEPQLPKPVLAETKAAATAVPFDPDELAVAQNLLGEARREADELRTLLAKAQEQLQALGLERDATQADLAKAQEQLQAAMAKSGAKAK